MSRERNGLLSESNKKLAAANSWRYHQSFLLYLKKKRHLELKGIFQPFELGGVTRCIRSAVKFWKAGNKIFFFLMIQTHERSLKLCGFKDICLYIHTMFTWYGHKNLINAVLTAAVSYLHYSTLWLQWQRLI